MRSTGHSIPYLSWVDPAHIFQPRPTKQKVIMQPKEQWGHSSSRLGVPPSLFSEINHELLRPDAEFREA